MLGQRTGKDVPAGPVSDEIERVGRCRVERRRDGILAGVGDRTDRKPRPRISIVRCLRELRAPICAARAGAPWEGVDDRRSA